MYAIPWKEMIVHLEFANKRTYLPRLHRILANVVNPLLPNISVHILHTTR